MIEIQEKKSHYSIQELATFLTPGMLGLQKANNKPFNLLFRTEKEADPRVKLLLDQGWFEIKDTEGVLWAAATLENYLELKENLFYFEPTESVGRWLNHISATSWSSALCYPPKDCPLFDYQKEAVGFLVSRDRAMLSLSPGLGKSLVSAYAAGLSDFHNVLLICPASLLYYWKNELEKWSEKLPMQICSNIWHRKIDDVDEEALARCEQFWAITNPETLARLLDGFLVKPIWDLMIVDESIMYKHRESVRSKQIKKMAQAVDNVWLLTGAPATRYLDDFWHQFHIINPRGFSSYWRFARKYCLVDDSQWGSAVVANRKNAESAIKRNYQDIYFSRTQDDVLDIPDWVFEDVDIPMLSAQDKVYEKLRKEFLIEIEGLEDTEVIRATNHLALMIRSVQVASNPLLVGAVDSSGKWDALPELMSIYPGPYIIWVNFIKTGEMLRERLSIERMEGRKKSTHSMRLALANGSTSMEDRNSMVNEFQSGKLDAIIMNNQVGKFGFTLTKARTAIFVERMYDDSFYQCLHRNRRIGTTESPIVVCMRSITQKGNRTIDHVIHDVLDYRTGMIKAVTAKMLKDNLKGEDK